MLNVNDKCSSIDNKPVIIDSVPKKARIISFKADNQDQFVRQNHPKGPVYTNPPILNQQDVMRTQLKKQNDEIKNQKRKNDVITAITLLGSLLMAVYFGKAMLNEHQAAKNMKKMEEKIVEAARQSGKNVDDLMKSLEDRILECSDPALQKAAMNEYQKGRHMRSEKRIKDILSLADLNNAHPEEVDLGRAIELMDKKIIGMQEVKEEVLDFLIKYNRNLREGIASDKPLVLAIDGPPGTGKTTISEVIAEALNMHYEKISLAGATGKSIIRGTEAQFVNASPGGVAKGQLNGKTKRVVYCIDEPDKVGTSDQHGNPLDALLSAFDDSNKGKPKFTDDNLDVDIDLSQSIFILATNDFGKLPPALKNRIKCIQIKPYTTEIKAKIANLKLTNAIQKNKIDSNVDIKEDAYIKLAELTSDGGGRETSRNVDSLVSKIIDIIELKEAEGGKIVVDADFVQKQLRPSASEPNLIERYKRAFGNKS